MIWGRASRSLPQEGGQGPRVLTRRGSCSSPPDRRVPPRSPRPGGAGMKAQSPAGTWLHALHGQDEPRRGLAGGCGAGCAPGTAAAPWLPHACPTGAEPPHGTEQGGSALLPRWLLAGTWDGADGQRTDGQRGWHIPPHISCPWPSSREPALPHGSCPPPAPLLVGPSGSAQPLLGACGTEGALAEISAVMLGPGSSGRALSVPFPPLAGALAKAAWPWVALAPGRVGAETCRAIKGLDTECCRAPPLLPSVQFI